MKPQRLSLLGASFFLGGVAAFSQNQFTQTTRTTQQMRAVMINIDENVQRDIWTMDEYMTNCGVQRAEGLTVYDSSTRLQEAGSDFGLMTQTDLPAQSPVVCVPANMILSSKDLREGELSGIVEPAEEYLEIMGVAKTEVPMYHLFLKILMEYEKGDESPWFPWLNSLPRRYSNGAAMTRAYQKISVVSIEKSALRKHSSVVVVKMRWSAIAGLNFVSE
jgi:hypothetical protein